ncbi:MAG TPA: prolyl oligopeptidase family serine peptidase [Actinomycetota bacterium]|nr:prolyl oligopeptidase family serine peptidase [Actinomycetota bacterium]
MSDMPLWERRFRAPKLTMPTWSRVAPDRAVFATNVSGVWQVHAWDAVSGEHRQVSNHPVGVTAGVAAFDGSEVFFWQEDTGDETGRWLAEAFEGGAAEPLLEGVPVAWSEGIAQGPGIVCVGLSERDGSFVIFSSLDGRQPKEIARSTEWLAIAGVSEEGSDLAGLSADGGLLALQHAEHGSLMHPSLRIVDPRTGGVVGERGDGAFGVIATAWSPVPGDRRLGVSQEPGDRDRAALWDLADDSWTELEDGLPGDVSIVDWWPDASALLLLHGFEGRSELYRYDLGGRRAERIDTPPGSISGARVRPDGTVWFVHTDGVHAPRVLDDRGAQPLAVADHAAPPGRPFHPWRYANDHGQEVHGWIVEPEGAGPHPVMVFVHGGPHWLYEDKYFPEVQSYVDAGFIVGMPNYRGSTGYGRAWRDALTGDPGFTDVDDVTAGLRDLLRRPDADPDRSVVAGWSWGGYITLMELGRNPDLWSAGMAGVPVGDYVMAYEEEAPSLKAMDRALFGGTPETKPDLFARANPITYVGSVAAPVLLVIGENDSRCPLGQAMAYADRLEELGRPHQVYRYATGHGALQTDEDVHQNRIVLDFLKGAVPGLADV